MKKTEDRNHAVGLAGSRALSERSESKGDGFCERDEGDRSRASHLRAVCEGVPAFASHAPYRYGVGPATPLSRRHAAAKAAIARFGTPPGGREEGALTAPS